MSDWDDRRFSPFPVRTGVAYSPENHPACIISTGTRGIIREMVKKKMFDVLITTCGTLDHDLARIWKHYYHGHFLMDDRELLKKGINRLGNVLVPNECI